MIDRDVTFTNYFPVPLALRSASVLDCAGSLKIVVPSTYPSGGSGGGADGVALVDTRVGELGLGVLTKSQVSGWVLF